MKNKLKRIGITLMTGLVMVGALPNTVDAANLNSFSDYGLVSTHWARSVIEQMMDRGALNGIQENNGAVRVAPNETVTVAQFRKMLLDLVDPNLTIIKNKIATDEDYQQRYDHYVNYYSDSSYPDWYKEYVILYATITNIPIEKTTNLDVPITRSNMAAYTYSLLSNSLYRDKYPLADTLNNIDNSISDYATKNYTNTATGKVEQVGWTSITALYSNGILSGDDKGNFNPGNSLTRAEACSVLMRIVDPSQRVEVVIQEDKAEDRYDWTNDATTTIYQSDQNRRSVKEGDIFITDDGRSIEVKLNTTTGTYNPDVAVGFDLGRINSLGKVNVVTSTSNGTAGGQFGDILVQAPNGHINWTSEFEKIYASGWDKPTTPGTTVGQLSPNKYYIWDEYFGWMQNSGFMTNIR